MTIRLNPYLGFRDTARQAMEFYHSVFGGQLTLTTFAELQASEDPAEQDKIMHGMVETDRGLVLMGADMPNTMASRRRLLDLPQRRRRVGAPPLLGGTVSERDRHDAAGARVVGGHVRHVRGRVRDQLDGQHGRARPR